MPETLESHQSEGRGICNTLRCRGFRVSMLACHKCGLPSERGGCLLALSCRRRRERRRLPMNVVIDGGTVMQMGSASQNVTSRDTVYGLRCRQYPAAKPEMGCAVERQLWSTFTPEPPNILF